MHVAARLSRVGERLLDLAIPPRCAGCGERDVWVCDECRAGLPPLPEAHCARCAAPGIPTRVCGSCYVDPPPFDELRAPFIHDGLARDLVLQLKYKRYRHLAAELAPAMAAVAPGDVAVVVPVPLHPRRRAERGFNQSELLAREIGARLDLPVAIDAIERVKDTRPQVELAHADRAANVQGAFAANRPLPDRAILLVDDVCTTGATLSACARALHRAGAKRVAALTATRASGLG